MRCRRHTSEGPTVGPKVRPALRLAAGGELRTQDNRGPHGRNRSQALRCVHPPLPVDPTLFWFSRVTRTQSAQTIVGPARAPALRKR